MASRDRDIYTLGIVLVGNFNPVIITPYWLSSKGIIREAEAETAKVHIIHPDITRFETDWLSFEATQTRLDFKTNRESHFSILRDLILSIFECLKETPISACGINHLCHYALRDIEEYHNFGYWLSPVLQLRDGLHEPKVLKVEYLETKDPENTENGYIRMFIQPSDLIQDNKSVLIHCNHHFDNLKSDAKSMMLSITSKWEYSFTKTNNVINILWEKAML